MAEQHAGGHSVAAHVVAHQVPAAHRAVEEVAIALPIGVRDPSVNRATSQQRFDGRMKTEQTPLDCRIRCGDSCQAAGRRSRHQLARHAALNDKRRVRRAVVVVQLRMDGRECTRHERQTNQAPTAGRAVDHSDNCDVDGDVGHIARYAVEHPAKFRRLPGHPGELTIGRIDNAVHDEESDADPREMRPSDESTASCANHAGEHRDGVWRQSRQTRANGDDVAEPPIEIDVDEFFDLVRLVGEPARGRQR